MSKSERERERENIYACVYACASGYWNSLISVRDLRKLHGRVGRFQEGDLPRQTCEFQVEIIILAHAKYILFFLTCKTHP